jgi:hypothetical protein
MISLKDCIGLCGLEEDKVAAISEHEHISEIAAADWRTTKWFGTGVLRKESKATLVFYVQSRQSRR